MSDSQPQNPIWGTVRLSSGFYLGTVVRSVLQFIDTPERLAAAQTALDLLDNGCTEEHKWRDAIEEVTRLCEEHPDAYKQSGTWYDGDACILSMALTREACRTALYKLHPDLHSDGKIEGCTFKVFRYLLRAMMLDPATAQTALRWVEHEVNWHNS